MSSDKMNRLSDTYPYQKMISIGRQNEVLNKAQKSELREPIDRVYVVSRYGLILLKIEISLGRYKYSLCTYMSQHSVFHVLPSGKSA